MLTKAQFLSLLEAEKTIVIDGALATELEARGHDLNHALWSAKLLREDPASIESVHLDYFLAGANVAITASYQATVQGLGKHFAMTTDDGKSLIGESARLALVARDTAYHQGVDSSRKLLVAGSIGPYGAYLADGSEYRGDYALSSEAFQDFHRPRIQALVDAGVDLLALETMPSLPEIRALLHLLKTEYPTAIAWLSCSSRDSAHLSDGSTWEAVLDTVHPHTNQIVAFGVNCVPFQTVTDTLRRLGQLTKMPLLCYPNSGEIFDAQTKTWIGVHPGDDLGPTNCTPHRQNLADEAAESPELSKWITLGAKLVGGCCRTGPAFIKDVARQVRTRQSTAT